MLQNPQEESSPEQTTSLFGFFSFSFISPLIYQARRMSHLPADMFPPQLDTDQMQVLGPRGARYFDPLLTPTREVRVRWGLLALFAGSWIRQAVVVTIGALAVLASPVGTNRLLAYIEKGGIDAVVRPWVWILFIALAPLFQSAAEQLYMYYAMRTTAHIETVITTAIFRHSLRIRVLNQADEELHARSSQSPSALPTSASALGPAHTLGTGQGQAVHAVTIHSRAESSATGATLVRSDGAKIQNGKGVGKKKQGRKAQDIVGKLNVLVTSDLKNINGGYEWIRLLLSTVLQAILGSWYVTCPNQIPSPSLNVFDRFLYTILGWSALVGVAVMILFLPIPAWVSKIMSGAQVKKMKATDRRVKYIKEVLTALRLIKILGYQEQVRTPYPLVRPCP
jgi:hypothetical protein